MYDTNTDGYADRNTESDANTDANSNPNTNTDTDRYSYGYSYRYAYIYTDTYPHRYSYGYSYRYAHIYTDTNTDTYTGSTNTYADCNSVAVTNGFTCLPASVLRGLRDGPGALRRWRMGPAKSQQPTGRWDLDSGLRRQWSGCGSGRHDQFLHGG